MGVYSGVYEYTQQIRNKYQVYRVYVYLGHLLSCRQDPCSTICTFSERYGVFKFLGAFLEFFTKNPLIGGNPLK